jgi:MFS family permease
MSDIFGRRWFFIVGCFISLSGTVVALAAQNVPMIIAGMILKGIGSGSQQLRFGFGVVSIKELLIWIQSCSHC